MRILLQASLFSSLLKWHVALPGWLDRQKLSELVVTTHLLSCLLPSKVIYGCNKMIGNVSGFFSGLVTLYALNVCPVLSIRGREVF